MDDFEIVAEYTGTEPNLRPAASVFARLIKSITNADGAFTDPDLEAEFQNWVKEKARQCCYTDGRKKGALTNELH